MWQNAGLTNWLIKTYHWTTKWSVSVHFDGHWNSRMFSRVQFFSSASGKTPPRYPIFSETVCGHIPIDLAWTNLSIISRIRPVPLMAIMALSFFNWHPVARWMPWENWQNGCEGNAVKTCLWSLKCIIFFLWTTHFPSLYLRLLSYYF